MQRLLMVMAVLVSTATVSTHASAEAQNPLIGTWRQVSGKFNGKAYEPPPGMTLIKHLTPTQFMFVDHDKDGKVTDAFGGPYVVKGQSYVETPMYGIGDFHGLKGKSQSFTWKVEGKRWYHSGTLSDGATIEEIWERVD